MPRIISGSAGGVRIDTPDGRNTRPTSDRAKEALFSMLGDIFDGISVLDLFSGSGSLGIEAVSRGAQNAVLVESDRKCADIIKRNIRKCRLDDSIRVLKADVRKSTGILASEGLKFKCIFMDPPYDSGYVDAVIEKITAGDIIEKEGILVVEHSNTEKPELNGTSFTLLKTRNYGAVNFSICRYESGEQGEV